MKFLPKKILAIDISDSSIEILQLSQFFGKMKVMFLSRSELPGAIVEKGKIKNKKELLLILKEYLGGSSATKVALALPDTVVFNHIFRFPAGNENIKKEDILEEARKTLPIDIEKSYWDFDTQDIDDEKVVFFAAALKKDIDEYKEVLEEAGLVPKLFDLNSLCALRAIETNHDGILVVDLGGRYGVLSIFDNNILQLTSLVNFGGENFTEKLAEKLGVSYDQAEIFKMNMGFDTDKEEGRVFLVLQEVMQPLINEIRKVLNFYEEKNKIKIKKIVLTGGSALMPKLGEYIFENFSIEAEVGRPFAGDLVLKYLQSRGISNGVDTIFFATTLGLAYKYLGSGSHFNIGVNLLEK